MNINLVGCRWSLPGTIKPAQFFRFLTANNDKEIRFKGYERILLTSYNRNYFCGVFLTIKNQTKITAFDKGARKVTVEELAKGKNLVDFNFFAIHPDTLIGIYQHYHQSPSVGTFCEFIEFLYEHFRTKLVEKEGGPGNGPDGKAKLRAAQKKYPEKMDTEQLVREDKLPALLEELARIKYCDVQIGVATADEKYFYPTKDAVSTQRLRISFRSKAKQGDIKKDLLQYIRTIRSGSGRIVGNTKDGIERTLFLIDNPDIFGTYKYEDIAKDGLVDYGKPADSPFMGVIVDEMINNDGVFGDQPKPSTGGNKT